MDEESIKRIVGQHVRACRHSMGLSQTKLAEMLDIKQRQMVRIEKGESIPSLSTLVKLAKIVDCNVDDFFKDALFDDKNNAIDKIVGILENCNLSQLSEIYSNLKIMKSKVVNV